MAEDSHSPDERWLLAAWFGCEPMARYPSVAASPLGHAVNPSMGARTQLLLRDGPREDLRRSRTAPSYLRNRAREQLRQTHNADERLRDEPSRQSQMQGASARGHISIGSDVEEIES